MQRLSAELKSLNLPKKLVTESQEKVDIIKELNLVMKKAGCKPMTPFYFYTLYELPIEALKFVAKNVSCQLSDITSNP